MIEEKNIKTRRTQKVQEEKNKIKKKRKKRGKKAMVLTFIMLLLIGAFGYLGVEQVVVPSIKGGQPLSILLVGSDINTYREEHYGGTKPEKTDSLIVLTFNPDTFRFVLTSIPRDTAVDYACGDIRGKINEQYAVSGNDIGCLEKTVEGYLNVPIDYYVKVNMDQLANVIDKVGPITIKAHAQAGYLEQENVEGNQTYSWSDGETYEMGSDEALTYARARHDTEKDYGRGIRQQQVIIALAKNILAQGINLGTIKDLLGMVDTNMQPLLLKKYYDYAKTFSKIKDSITDKKLIDKKELSDSTWKSMFEYFEYDEKEITEETVTAFQKDLVKTYSNDEINEYFLERHQFVNDTYGGFYVTPADQLNEISNALRKNLGLKEETPPEPQKPFGTNTFEKEQVVSSAVDGTVTDQSGTTYTVDQQNNPYYDASQYEDYATEEETTTETPTETEADSDGDGIVDSQDEYPGGEDTIDSDGDGTPDISDKYPGGEDTIDSDGDGTPDISDKYPGGEDTIDSDGDGIVDIDDEFPDDPNNGEIDTSTDSNTSTV